MQAVILAAGYGTRMGDLTRKIPKPLLKAGTKTLLEHKIDTLPEIIDEIIIVVGFLGKQIINYIGNSKNGKSIKYTMQEKLNGTAGALHTAKNILNTDFIVMMGDDMYDTRDIYQCIQKPWAINTKRVSQTESGGEVLIKENLFVGIHEEKHWIENGHINTGLYMMQKSFFDYTPVLVPGTKEFGIPHTLVSISKNEPIVVVSTNNQWIKISNQKDLDCFKKQLL